MILKKNTNINNFVMVLGSINLSLKFLQVYWVWKLL